MSSPTTKADAIQAELRREILNQEWKVGDKLPSDGVLAERFGCSIATASKAVSLLAHDGLVERRPRAGTRVVRNTPEPESTAPQLDSFAFIYPSEQHEGIWRTVRGFQDAANASGRRVIMLSTGSDYRKEAEYISRLSEFDVRGAVIYPVIPTQQDQVHFSQMLVTAKIPLVLAELNLPGLGCPAVVIDGFHAGYTMARHLLDKGARRVGFFSNYSWAPFMRDRYLGYRWAMEERGIAMEKESVLLEPSMRPDFKDPFREVRELARTYLQKNEKLEAVVCANDFLARGLIDSAHERGLRVPGDLKVTGIDGYASYMAAPISLTTYHIPYEEMGRKAFETLSAHVRNRDAEPVETQVRGHIVAGATSAS